MEELEQLSARYETEREKMRGKLGESVKLLREIKEQKEEAEKEKKRQEEELRKVKEEVRRREEEERKRIAESTIIEKERS